MNYPQKHVALTNRSAQSKQGEMKISLRQFFLFQSCNKALRVGLWLCCPSLHNKPNSDRVAVFIFLVLGDVESVALIHLSHVTSSDCKQMRSAAVCASGGILR